MIDLHTHAGVIEYEEEIDIALDAPPHTVQHVPHPRDAGRVVTSEWLETYNILKEAMGANKKLMNRVMTLSGALDTISGGMTPHNSNIGGSLSAALAPKTAPTHYTLGKTIKCIDESGGALTPAMLRYIHNTYAPVDLLVCGGGFDAIGGRGGLISDIMSLAAPLILAPTSFAVVKLPGALLHCVAGLLHIGAAYYNITYHPTPHGLFTVWVQRGPKFGVRNSRKLLTILNHIIMEGDIMRDTPLARLAHYQDQYIELVARLVAIYNKGTINSEL